MEVAMNELMALSEETLRTPPANAPQTDPAGVATAEDPARLLAAKLFRALASLSFPPDNVVRTEGCVHGPRPLARGQPTPVPSPARASPPCVVVA